MLSTISSTGLHSRHINVAIIICTINTANNTKNTSSTYSMPEGSNRNFQHSNILLCAELIYGPRHTALNVRRLFFLTNLAMRPKSSCSLTIWVL